MQRSSLTHAHASRYTLGIRGLSCLQTKKISSSAAPVCARTVQKRGHVCWNLRSTDLHGEGSQDQYLNSRWAQRSAQKRQSRAADAQQGSGQQCWTAAAAPATLSAPRIGTTHLAQHPWNIARDSDRHVEAWNASLAHKCCVLNW